MRETVKQSVVEFHYGFLEARMDAGDPSDKPSPVKAGGAAEALLNFCAALSI
jgi:hypothetical protein